MVLLIDSLLDVASEQFDSRLTFPWWVNGKTTGQNVLAFVSSDANMFSFSNLLTSFESLHFLDKSNNSNFRYC